MCRTRVIGNHYDPNNEISNGRGNLSFTSINLPRMAIEANHDIDKFFEILDHYTDLVVDQLYDRYLFQKKKKVRNFPFLMGQGVWIGSENLKEDDELGDIINHGTLSMGFIGLAEALIALIGKHHGESEEAQELGLRIVKHMREKMDEASVLKGLNYTLLATPAENLSGRFIKKDKEIYGIIKDVTEREYYTNSNHVPVYYPISAYDKIDIEAPYCQYTNAGHITYIELDGDPAENLSAFESVVNHMKERGVGYGSINHEVDHCKACGYSGIIKDSCPVCGASDPKDIERIARITG